MAYEQTLTTAQLIDAINDNLSLEMSETAGRDPAVIGRALNAAARRLADELALSGRREHALSITRTVAQGDATVALPDGSDADEPRVRRFLELLFARPGGTPAPLHIFEGREVLTHAHLAAAGSLAVCWEGLTLRWLCTSGAPLAGTLTINYLPALGELDAGDRDGTPFELLPREYLDVIIDEATARLLPAAHPARPRYETRAAETLARLLVVAINKYAGAGAAAQYLGPQRTV